MNDLLTRLAVTVDETKPNSTETIAIPKVSETEILLNGLNLAYFLAGLIAVIVIIFAGIMYVASSGDAGRVTKAKNLLMYSIVGLVIVLTAFAITSFVTGRLSI